MYLYKYVYCKEVNELEYLEIKNLKTESLLQKVKKQGTIFMRY